MDQLVLIRQKDDPQICYIADARLAHDKLEDTMADYVKVPDDEARRISDEYAAFKLYGAKDLPDYTFTASSPGDWYVAQVEIKEAKPL